MTRRSNSCTNSRSQASHHPKIEFEHKTGVFMLLRDLEVSGKDCGDLRTLQRLLFERLEILRYGPPSGMPTQALFVWPPSTRGLSMRLRRRLVKWRHFIWSSHVRISISLGPVLFSRQEDTLNRFNYSMRFEQSPKLVEISMFK